MILRTIVAILFVIVIRALLGPVFEILGFPLDANVAKVLLLLVALGAILYIIRGAPIPPFWRQS